MDWQLRDNSVYAYMGYNNGNYVAAFDFDNTLAWSDSGLIFMRTERDWVSTVSVDVLISLFTYFYRNNWTIVIFTNQLENNPAFTRTALERIENFITQLQNHGKILFDPYVYVAIRNDVNRKPNIGMWNMFIIDTNIVPSIASFYCGDASGDGNQNPLYRWADFDSSFATNIGLAFYTPDELLGEYRVSVDPRNSRVILVMAAHESQYRSYIDELKGNNPQFIESNLDNVVNWLEKGNSVIVVGERFATQAGRRRALHLIPRKYHRNTIVLMFTRPIKPFIGDQEYKAVDMTIRGYANALDVHLNFASTLTLTDRGNEPFTIYRIN